MNICMANDDMGEIKAEKTRRFQWHMNKLMFPRIETIRRILKAQPDFTESTIKKAVVWNTQLCFSTNSHGILLVSTEYAVEDNKMLFFLGMTRLSYVCTKQKPIIQKTMLKQTSISWQPIIWC